MPAHTSLNLRHPTARSPLAPEPLEGRVLLSGVVGADTISLGTGDFNRDGADDEVLFARTRRARQLLAQSGSAAAVPRRSSLFFTDGLDGSLLGGVSLPRLGQAAPLLAVGDFNGDGRPDLAVAAAGRRSGGIQVLLGAGDGTFSRARSVAAPGNLTSLSAGDVNGDSRADLIATSTVASGPRRTGGSGSTIMPDFRFELETAGRLLVPPATGGGVTAEAGGGSDAFGTSGSSLAGINATGLLGLGGNAGVDAYYRNGTLAGTYNPQPGASAEAGGGVARVGANFSDVGVGDTAEILTVLFGNGDGTFRPAGQGAS